MSRIPGIVMLSLLAPISCGGPRAPAPVDPAKPVVRFMHDPIRVDGHGVIRREDFHRYAVRQVASDWLPVLALGAALERDVRLLDREPPTVARIRELQALIRSTESLRTRFPAFPRGTAATSETCTLRLALALGQLEAVLGSKSDDASVHVRRLDDALTIYSPVLTRRGASCCGVAIDAREVWPELLARSDVPWREDLVRKALRELGV